IRPAVRAPKLDLHPAERDRRARRAHPVRQAGAAELQLDAHLRRTAAGHTPQHRAISSPSTSEESMWNISDERIPNNVDLSSDKRLQRALEQWQPAFIDWWKQMGPEGFQLDDVYLRTAISVQPGGWANSHYA